MTLQSFINPTVSIPVVLLVGSCFTKEIFFPSVRETMQSNLIRRIFRACHVSLENLQQNTRYYKSDVKHTVSAYVDNLWLTTLVWGILQKIFLGRNDMYLKQSLPSTLLITLYGSALLHFARKVGANNLPYYIGRYIAPSYNEHTISIENTPARVPLQQPAPASSILQPDQCDADTAVLGHFLDPITQTPINEAVRRKSNNKIVFDRASIEEYIRRMISEGRDLTCPVTREPISLDDLEPAYDIQGIINARIQKLRLKIGEGQIEQALL